MITRSLVLKLYREADPRNLTQKDLAHLAGVSLGTVQRAEQGNAKVTAEMWEKLAKPLGADPAQMVFLAEDLRRRFATGITESQPTQDAESKPPLTESMIPLQKVPPVADGLTTPNADQDEGGKVAEEPGLFKTITGYWDSVDGPTRKRMVSACHKMWDEFLSGGAREKTGTGDERGNE